MSRDRDARAVKRALDVSYSRALDVVRRRREDGTLASYIVRIAALGYVPEGAPARCVECLEVLTTGGHFCSRARAVRDWSVFGEKFGPRDEGGS